MEYKELFNCRADYIEQVKKENPQAFRQAMHAASKDPLFVLSNANASTHLKRENPTLYRKVIDEAFKLKAEQR